MEQTPLSIGEFARMTYLSVKALRHYHDLGLLVPADVDPTSGYRYYDVSQVPTAQLIRRFRDLGMPLDEVRVVLDADDPDARNRVVSAHLARMEARLADTQSAVASLRTLLEGRLPPTPATFRTFAAQHTVAVRAEVAWNDSATFFNDALGAITATLEAAGAEPAGPCGALFYEAFFEDQIGDMVAFVPVTSAVAASGDVHSLVLPEVTVAVMTHLGPAREIDQTYGALGTYVAERGLGVPGPIREDYVVSADATPDETQHRTDVSWPVHTIPA